MKPGRSALVDLAARTLAPTARVIDVGGPPSPPPALAGRPIQAVREDEALALLASHRVDPVDALLAAWPARELPLLRFLDAARGALRPDGRALVLDLAWRTAPTLELLRAFAPAPGREKVRPIEGYEMQAEHAGFEVVERAAVPREAWAPALPGEARAAVETDERRAAELVLWVLRPSVETAY